MYHLTFLVDMFESIQDLPGETYSFLKILHSKFVKNSVIFFSFGLVLEGSVPLFQILLQSGWTQFHLDVENNVGIAVPNTGARLFFFFLIRRIAQLFALYFFWVKMMFSDILLLLLWLLRRVEATTAVPLEINHSAIILIVNHLKLLFLNLVVAIAVALT